MNVGNQTILVTSILQTHWEIFQTNFFYVPLFEIIWVSK